MKELTGKDLHELLRYLKGSHPNSVGISRITGELKWEMGKIEKLLRYAREKGWVQSGLSGSKLTSKGMDKFNNWTDADDKLRVEAA